MQIKKATRESTHLIISLTGPSGSGKTKSALRLAEGLGEKIGFIDTESGRSGLYADEHNFDVLELESPFTPDRYIEALRKFEDAGYDVVIIDSASHEWEGIGGVLDFADSQKSSKGKPLQGLLKWKEPKSRHKKFVSELLRTRMHVIVCLRAKPVFEQRKGADGRDEIVMVGYKEIAESSFIYEMTVSAMLSNEAGRQGFPSMTKCPGALVSAFPSNAPINENTGREIAAWLGKIARDPELELLHRTAGDEAESGTEALQEFWGTLTKKQQLKLKPSMEGFKAKAREADAQPEDESVSNANLEDPFNQSVAAD
ncbi:AAA family ATPase [Parvibaculum sp.]|uniref:AAA family ATPase n=1 Tax=Parvibaculum sp. TaxID=2024848 RepID=UPI001DE3E913|nr:AAA family ATPase [Parvibaculum sp.]MBX3488533.1 AAA family ATPase [Parvibaculum sp.]